MMMTNNQPQPITWFKTSPDADDPTCLCSWCEQPIGEHEAPIIRLFNSDAGTEARFHRRCLVESGVLPGVTFPEDELTSNFDYAPDGENTF
jgi:hypothetical protein